MRIHRSVHKSRYTVISNGVVWDTALSFNALGLLLRLLSLRDGDTVNIRTLAAERSTGRDAVRSGLRELARRGYYRVVRIRDAVTGRIHSVSHVYETPYVPEAAEAAEPAEPAEPGEAGEAAEPGEVGEAGGSGECPGAGGRPAAGNPHPGGPHPGIPGTTPTGVVTTTGEVLTTLPGDGPDARPGPCPEPEPLLPEPARPRRRTVSRPAPLPGAVAPVTSAAPAALPAPAAPAAPGTPPGPVSAAARVVLHGLTAADHRLTLGARDRAALAPLVEEWLARGATDGQIVAAATQGLPATLRNPAALLTYRLKDKLPPEPRPAPPRPPALAEHPECEGCDRPLITSGPRSDGLCGDCRQIRDTPLLPPGHWALAAPSVM
ncbi:hypothetical protein GCM10018781_05300 [Kitasatospora indigofera]|uniref:Helix-turn-helix domain-containing protein n=1 Tax=Kitasatospora indigofera TaxID=67307 RepID=A0A919FC51_9ACTN|nr:hypothetical protein [Kitasatospora indigofera]GHH60500.1 hypothetical protein GCM10018781_05300 [Kitasatospora indigofera]